MPVSQTTSAPPVAVLLPGSGSDEVFVRAAFEAPLRAAGVTLWTPPVRPGPDLVAGYRRELDRAAEQASSLGSPLLVGGVSLGAQVAARWAADRLRRPDPAAGSRSGPGAGSPDGSPAGRGAGSSAGAASRARPAAEPPAGLLLVLPAWTGPPGDAPAAVSAATTAREVRRDGLEAAVRAVRAGAPEWLADELARSWRRHGPALAASLEATAATHGPSEAALGALRVPTAVVALADDPIHPVEVARSWHGRLPRSALVVSTLAALGGDPAVLGRAAVLAWWRASLLPGRSPRAD